MTERDDEGRVVLAAPDSLLGMLQRGRGKGYLIALERPPQEVWPLLLECVTNDPRVDKQCEPRAEYYAFLILKTGMDLEPIRSHLKRMEDQCCEDPWETVLALEALGHLAQQGNGQALEILREYLRYGSGWVWIAGILADLSLPGAMDEVDQILYERISSDSDAYEQLQDRIEEDWAKYCQMDEEARKRCRRMLPMCEPWKTLCDRNEDLARLFLRNGLPYDPPAAVPKVTDADLADLSVGDLLSAVDKENFYPSRRAIIVKVSREDEDRLVESLSAGDEYQMRLALRGLGELGTSRAFEAVRSYIEASEHANRRVRATAFDAIEEMPRLRTLETARRWFSRAEWYLFTPGARILEHHATNEDIPLLVQSLRTPEILRGEDCRLRCALGALARFKGLGRIPEIEQVFCQTEDSFRRGDAAEAMAATAPDHFTSEYAYECLWDCDWTALQIGCAMVDLSMPGAIERLKEIADDACESDNTREIAKKRLEGGDR